MFIPDYMIEAQFLATLRREDITPDEELFPLDGSGSIVRFRTVNDKPTEKSGAYYFHADGHPNWGVMEYGKHSGMVQDKFRFDRLTDTDKERLREENGGSQGQSHGNDSTDEAEIHRRAEARKARMAELEAEQKAGLARAWERYSRGVKGQQVYEHPYLYERFFLRGVDYLEFMEDFHMFYPPYVWNAPAVDPDAGGLLVPLSDVKTRAFRGLQWISGKSDGEGHFPRGFTKGSDVRGACYEFDVPALKSAPAVLVCEGWCTGLALLCLMEAVRYTGHPFITGKVFASLSSANMPHVCRALRERYPSKRIYVMTDHDGATQCRRSRNPGRDAGQECIDAGVADVMMPAMIIGRETENTDYYDVMIEELAEC